MRKKFIHFLWGALVTVVVFSSLAFTAIWFGWIGYMPDLSDLQNPINRYATQVYSADGGDATTQMSKVFNQINKAKDAYKEFKNIYSDFKSGEQ